LNEIAKLSEERRHLQAQVEQLKANDGELRVPPDIRHRLDEMLNLDVQTLVVTNAHPLIKPQSLLKLFVAVYKRFAQPCNVGTAKMVINEVLGVSYPQVGVDLIIDELCAQNIIEFIRLPGANGGSFKHYKLTDYGKECAMFAKLLVSSPSREDA
jgi:hypothetical protein